MKLSIAEDIDKHACIRTRKIRRKNSCTCCTKKRLCCPSCKRYERYAALLHRVSIAFSSMGLPFTPPEGTTRLSRMKTIASKLVAVLMHLFMAYRCLVLFYRVRTAGYTVMTALFVIAREGLVLAIWHSVRSRSEKIVELFKCTAKTSQLFPSGPKSRFMERLFYAALVGIYIFALLVALLMAVTLSRKEAEKYQATTAFAVITKEEHTHSFDFMLYCLYNLYTVPLPFVVSLVYVYICTNLRKMLNHCSRSVRQRGQQMMSVDDLRRIFQKSVRLASLVRKTEDALSAAIFFVVSLNLTLTFTSLAYALGYYETTVSATSGALLWFVVHQASFALIVCTASDVRNEASTLKSEFRLALMNVSEQDDRLVSFSQHVWILDSIALTGWKMFGFSKGLILNAAGNILTYGLLILQTENSTFSSGREN